MACFVCKKLNVTLNNDFVSITELSSDNLEILKRRLCYLQIDEECYVGGNICKTHKDEYLKWYKLRQRTCCDPLNNHPGSNRTKSLKTISLKLSESNPQVLIPGKKLCVECYSHYNLSVGAVITLCDTTKKDQSDQDFGDSSLLVEQLDKSYEVLGMSPVKVSRISSNRKRSYMQNKVKKLSKCVATKAATILGIDSIDDPQEPVLKKRNCSDCKCMMEKLLCKFKNASFKEKIQILTLVPDSWTIVEIKNYFSTTEYLVKKSQNLKTEGLLSIPSARKSVKLSPDTKQKVINFYYDDNNSRVCPGKKDCVSVPTENGRILKQKRLILHNLKELHIAFKEQNPDLMIGLSKFCELRPRECVTVGSKGIHSVCVCIYHQNVKLMLQVIHVRDYLSLLKKLVCSTESEKCMVHRCNNCPSPDILKAELLLFDDLETSYEITYKQWDKTDRTELRIITTSVDEFVGTLVKKLNLLCAHHFFTKVQSEYFKQSKAKLNVDNAIIVADFSENYTCIVQDAIQSFHWKKEQATVHPFLAYVKDANTGNVKTISMCIISDHLTHDTTTFWAFQKVVINHLLGLFPGIKCIKYFSDGASSQYKNYKNFVNLCHHEEDYGAKGEWHFFASCHGKGACDGIGGTIKRLATRASLQHPHERTILNPVDLFNFSKETIKGIKVFFVGKSEIEIASIKLEKRYALADTIPGTRTNHCFVPINETQLRISRVSGSKTSFIATMGFEQNIKPLELQNEQYVACVYGSNWWIGRILESSEEHDDYKIMFMHPHGPNISYMWPNPTDVCWIPYEHILKIVPPPITTTGRTYHISTENNTSIGLLFKSFN